MTRNRKYRNKNIKNTYWKAHSVLAIPCIGKNIPFIKKARLCRSHGAASDDQ
jgi:hypothetical protein